MTNDRISGGRDKEKESSGGKTTEVESEIGKPRDTFREQPVSQVGSGLVVASRKGTQGEKSDRVS